MTIDAPARPEPVSQPESDRYWEGARNGELWLQRDKATGEYQFYPRAFSLVTPGGEVEWLKASGERGVAHVRHRSHPAAPWFHGRSAVCCGDCGVGGGAEDGGEHRGRGSGAGESEHRYGAEGRFHEDQRRLHAAKFHAGLMPFGAFALQISPLWWKC